MKLGYAKVKQRRYRCKVLCYAQSEVKCATTLAKQTTLAQQLHDASASLHAPIGALSAKKESFVW